MFGFNYGFNYGIGAGQSVAPVEVPPYFDATKKTGWIGDVINFVGDGIYDISRDTKFTDPQYNTQWVESGTNQFNSSISGNARLISAGGVNNSLIKLQNGLPFYAADITLRGEVLALVDKPTDDIEYIALELAGSINSFRIVRKWSKYFGDVYQAYILSGTDSMPAGWIKSNNRICDLRIVWHDGHVVLLARDYNSDWYVIGMVRNLAKDTMYVSVSASNGNTDHRVLSRLILFRSKSNVLYGHEPALLSDQTKYEIITIVPDPVWNRYELSDVTVEAFNHNGVRGDTTFKYIRSAYSRIKTSNAANIDYIGQSYGSQLQVAANYVNVPFKLPGRLPFA